MVDSYSDSGSNFTNITEQTPGKSLDFRTSALATRNLISPMLGAVEELRLMIAPSYKNKMMTILIPFSIHHGDYIKLFKEKVF